MANWGVSEDQAPDSFMGQNDFSISEENLKRILLNQARDMESMRGELKEIRDVVNLRGEINELKGMIEELSKKECGRSSEMEAKEAEGKEATNGMVISRESKEDEAVISDVKTQLQALSREVQKLKEDRHPNNSDNISLKIDELGVSMFEAPAFPKFKRGDDPKKHLMVYQEKLALYNLSDDEKLQMFSGSLKDSCLQWYAKMDKRGINTWPLMKKEFIAQYNSSTKRTVAEVNSLSMRKGVKESLSEYASRWKEMLIERFSFEDSEEQNEEFLNTLDLNYTIRLSMSTHVPFNVLVAKAEYVESSVADGSMIDLSTMQPVVKQVKEELVIKGSDKERKKDETLCLPANKNDEASGSGASYSKCQKTWFRDREFTPLGESYEIILQMLKKKGLIVAMIPPPKHDINSRNFDPSMRCTFHSDARGHSTENCWHLKHTIQDLIDAKKVIVESEETTKKGAVEGNLKVAYSVVKIKSASEKKEGKSTDVGANKDNVGKTTAQPILLYEMKSDERVKGNLKMARNEDVVMKEREDKDAAYISPVGPPGDNFQTRGYETNNAVMGKKSVHIFSHQGGPSSKSVLSDAGSRTERKN